MRRDSRASNITPLFYQFLVQCAGAAALIIFLFVGCVCFARSALAANAAKDGSNANADAGGVKGAVNDVYASELLLRELLCEGETHGKSCGPDAEGKPMVCSYAESCSYVKPCIICLDAAVAKTTGTDDSVPVGPRIVRLPETYEQQHQRAILEQEYINRSRVLAVAALLATLSGAFVVFLLARARRSGEGSGARTRRAVPRWSYALVVITVVGAGAARMRERSAHDAYIATLTEIEHSTVVEVVPFQAKVPRMDWQSFPDECEDNRKRTSQLKKLLDEKSLRDGNRRTNWRTHASDAGATDVCDVER